MSHGDRGAVQSKSAFSLSVGVGMSNALVFEIVTTFRLVYTDDIRVDER